MALVTLVALVIVSLGASSLRANPDYYYDRVLLGTAFNEMAQGRFDLANEFFRRMDPNQVDDPYVKQLFHLKSRHEQLRTLLKDESQRAYDEYVKEMYESVRQGRTLAKQLNSAEPNKQSVGSGDSSTGKAGKIGKIGKTGKIGKPGKAGKDGNPGKKADADPTSDSELREQWADHWIEALQQMTNAVTLAKRTNLKDTIDSIVRDEITENALTIAGQLQDEENWIDAYNDVYFPLSLIEKSNRYEEDIRKLLRRISLETMYIPDPNYETIPWEDRLDGVTYDIFYYALSVINAQYVDEPDFREMTLRALENCQLFINTKKLTQTFPQLADQKKLQPYKEKLQQLREQLTAQAYERQARYILPLEYLREILAINRRTLKLPEEVIIEDFSTGAFSALDARTQIVWPSDVEEFQKGMTQEFSGIGIEINKNGGRLTVGSLLDENSPAGRAGLDAEDIIVAIDGRPTEKMSLEMAVRLITGPKGTDVTLTIDREGFDTPRDFVVTRDHIVVQTVKGLYRDEDGDWQYFFDMANGDDGDTQKIAYVWLTNFAEESPERLGSLLLSLKSQGMDGLILDLRNNTGGYLPVAIKLVNFFLDKGLIVTTKHRNKREDRSSYARTEECIAADLPLVILINSSSASASEILAGALKDQRRALIVGTRSYGKGSVQIIQRFRHANAELKLTIAYYELPSGRRIHRDPEDKADEDYGVQPDVKVELPAKLLKSLNEVRHEAGVLHRNDIPPDQRSWQLYSSLDILESDPQLELALICLKSQLISNEFERTRTGSSNNKHQPSDTLFLFD